MCGIHIHTHTVQCFEQCGEGLYRENAEEINVENPHGQRSLAGYSPCGLKELDTTE